MNTRLPLTTIAAWMMSALVATAQAQTAVQTSVDPGGPAPMTGPLARAAIREALHLADAPIEPVMSLDSDAQRPRSDWSRVRDLKPGTQVVVIALGRVPATRYVITHEEFGLTVLNVTDATLPLAARDELRELASHHPERFVAAHQGRTFALGTDVRLAPDGVYVGDRMVADFRQVVEYIDRHDVVEINTAEGHRSWLGCGFVGYAGLWLGGMAGGVTGAYVANSFGGLAWGGLIGGSVGAVWSYRKCRNKPEELIYRRE